MAQAHVVMAEETVGDIRRRIGVDWQPREPYFSVQATQGAMRHFAQPERATAPLPSRQEASA